MKVLYAVPWIEIEYGWGSRPEGYKLFESLEECKKQTAIDSEVGNYSGGGGYCGPERPLHYYETTHEINIPLPGFINNLKFKSNIKYF